MDWIDLTQDRDQWRALVNMIMNLNKMFGKSRVAAQQAACHEWLSSVELMLSVEYLWSCLL
jgi:hypothetical protein